MHTGCVPSKALIAAAKELHSAKKAAVAFGLELKGKADYHELSKESREPMLSFNITTARNGFAPWGWTCITDTVNSGTRIISKLMVTKFYGKRIVIATGSRPDIPPIDGLQDVDATVSIYVTN